METMFFAGHKVLRFPVLDSTNIQAKHLAREGEAHGTVILADEQTCGRGRLNRKWLSRPGYGAWFTMIIRPEMGRVRAEQTAGLVFVAALAMAQALNQQTDGAVRIKWPNDLVIHGRKICGAMCEMSATTEGLEWAVLGIGVNLRGRDFPADLPWAGSVESETATILSAEETLHRFLICFDELYALWLADGLSPILRAISPLSATLGRQVRVIQPDGKIFTGRALRMQDDGALVVESAGIEQVLRAGDVSVRGMMDYI